MQSYGDSIENKVLDIKGLSRVSRMGVLIDLSRPSTPLERD